MTGHPPAVGDRPVEALAGDGAETFEVFARRVLPDLLRYATALAGDRHTGADVVQEVMVRAHQRWGRIRRTERPDLYLRRMVTNEHLSWRRRWHTRSVVPTDDRALHARTAPSPDATAQVADRDDLRSRLARLPRRQRAVLVLRYYEGLDDPEIAEVLGVAPGTVRSSASRALASLRREATTEEQR